jgi:hypothetical protein
MFKVMIPVAVLTMVGTTVAAKPALRDVPSIDGAIFAVGLANKIRKQCPNISPRYIKALRLVNGLRDKAFDMGYSDAEIDAYRKSSAEKARLKAKTKTYLKANGVKVGNPQSFCALGRAEIKKSSQIGALLKVN